MALNLKTLGLALGAVLAMTAAGASAASASQYTGSAYPTPVTGSNTAGNETFTTPGGFPQCDSHFAASLIAAGSTLTITPKYTNCVAFGFLNATISMNGCAYALHAGPALNIGEGIYDNSVDIFCPSGSGPVRITSGTCVVDVPAQTGLTSVKTTNLAGGTLTVQPNVTNITMNVTTDGFGCPFPGTGHYLGSYHGDVVLSRVGGGSISVSGD